MNATLLKILILFLIFLLAAAGCSSKSEEQVNNGKTEQKSISKIDEISPGTIRVKATVKKIYTDRLSKNENSPCSKVPCNARIIVEKILGRGHSFNEVIHVGDSVDVNFAFTTVKTTKELFPNINKEYPGVSVGDKIITNLSGGTLFLKDEAVYSITDYELTGN
ncbi:MAG: hypothetical protein K9J16_00305 [Melioribacteraceae bacterium]|nr:hypothetical protein [Melioribacteraceae bacterium]MCF8355029.1 hypothetical protein [Melioribacteraceae bacterium]MCF8392708.1 hypothetical protein [Melioribacteraceae bacterium]MCF8417730.1 hypothetical protein [Melioribacteraceae bacterium]